MENVSNVTLTEEKTEKDFNEAFDLKIQKTVKPKTQTMHDFDVKSVSCFVLLTDSKAMNYKEGSYNIDLLGCPMFEYVVRACPTPPACLKYEEGQNIISMIRPYIKNTEYSLVLYSDTPLITKSNIMNILEFTKNKGLNVCKLTRGWVFNNEYIKHVDEIYAPSTYYFEEEDFMVASTYKQLYIVAGTLKNRIISYHMRGGVYFKDPDSTYIESNVSIGANTVIEPFVCLKKNTIIEENAFIGARSTLVNARIFSGASVDGAYIDGGIIMNNAKVKNGAKIYSQTAIKEGAEIAEECIINNAVIGEHSMVNKNTSINYLNCDKNVTIGSSCNICGEVDRAVSIAEGATIGDFVTLLPNTKVGVNERVYLQGERK